MIEYGDFLSLGMHDLMFTEFWNQAADGFIGQLKVIADSIAAHGEIEFIGWIAMQLEARGQIDQKDRQFPLAIAPGQQQQQRMVFRIKN